MEKKKLLGIEKGGKSPLIFFSFYLFIPSFLVSFWRQYDTFPNLFLKNSVCTNFRLELIEPSAREVFNFWASRERRAGGEGGRKREYCSNLARLQSASKLKKLLIVNLSSRRLYKLHSKISGHAVGYNP